MAASLSKDVAEQEENLCCYICLELYDQPRTLPCLHSYCHVCLVGYVKRAFDEGKQTINCPICRANTKRDKSVVAGNAEKWAESLPVNVELVSILSSKKRPLPDVGFKCDQCLRDEMESSATVYCYECSEKLCEKCKDMHKKVKISSSHRLCDINKQEDVVKLERLKSLTRCPKHLSDEVRYICKDHNQMCCNECAILEHRKCNEMVSIAKEQEDIGRSAYGTSYKLQQLIEYLEVLIGHETKHQSTVKSCKTEMKDKFKQIKKRIDSAFYAMEKAVFAEFEEKSSLILKESTLHKEEIESLQSEIKHSLVEMETAKEFGQPLHVFLVDRILQDKLAKLENWTSQIYDKMSKTVVHVVEDNDICKELDRIIAASLKSKMEPSSFLVPSVPRILKYKSWLEATETNVRRQTKALYHSSNTKRYVPVVDHNRPQERNKNIEESGKPDINVRNVVFNGADDDFGEIDDNDTRLDDLEFTRRVSCSRLQKKDKRKYRKN